jgi:hypothetical protein
MTDTTAVYAEIVKHERDANGDLVVFGRATGPDLDLDRQICDPEWLKTAMPEWFKIGNVREQHSSIAAGVGTEITQKPDGGWDLKSLVVDANSARKVERGVLKGYSIGIRAPQVIKDASAPGGRITGGQIVEVSLVDRPANPTCQLTLAKALKPGPMTVAPGTVDFDRSLVKVEELHEDLELQARLGDEIEKRDWSAEERRRAAREGHAKRDGSFPIENRADVQAAVRVAKKQDRPWVKRRAAAVGASDLIPDSWKAAEALELIKSYDLVAVRKGDQAGDIADANQAIALIAGLIQSEAACLADGMESEACDIALLLDAVRALEWFIRREEKEPTMAHVELAGTPDTEKAAAPDAAPTAPVEEPIETPSPAAEKAAGDGDGGDPAAPNDDLTELVKALSAEVSELKGSLTKALNAPAPGGPVLTRTTGDTAKAEGRETHLTKAAHWERLAYEVTDQVSRAGYLQMAADERAAATS